MEYCRSLKFEQEPNYKQCIGLFEGCAARHNFDMGTKDFTWKQNRLSKDKEALKAQLMNVIKKKPEAKQNATQSGVKRESTALAEGGDQEYQG